MHLFSVRRTILSILLLCAAVSVLSAQYVRKSTFRTEQERRTVYALSDWISYSPIAGYSTIAVGANYLYFATRGGGILRYHFYDDYWDYPFTTSSGLPSNEVVDVRYDPDRSFIHAVFPNDVAVFNPASEEWIRKSQRPSWPYSLPGVPGPGRAGPQTREVFFPSSALKDLPTFFANRPFTILGDWTLQDDHFEEYPIAGYLIDRYDRIWFPVNGYGIGQGDLFSQRADFYRMGLPAISPRGIAYQGQDIWIGGVPLRGQRGDRAITLWPVDEAGWRYFQARWISELPSNNALAVETRGDSVWIGTDQGVALFDRRGGEWTPFDVHDGLVSNEVRDLEFLGDMLYVATAGGISRILLKGAIVERVEDPRFTGLEFNRLARQGDTLWAGTTRGMFRYAPGFTRWEYVATRAAIQDYDVRAVGAYQGEVWVASDGGVMRWQSAGDTWQSFPQIAFEVDPPYADIQVNEAAVWVATRDGLLKFDRQGQFWKLFTTRDGLLDNRCYRLLLDGDYIWVLTERGVTQFYWNDPDRSDY